MPRLSPRHRPWVVLFALWLMFEPVVVTMVRAQELPQPVINTQKVDGIQNIDEVMTPAEYLEYMLELQQASTKEELETKVWGDWLMTITGAYMLMDAGCQDVFSFYSALRSATDVAGSAPDVVDFLKLAVKKVHLLVAFIGRTTGALRGLSMFNGFLRATARARQVLNKSRVWKFLEFMAPPPCWHNPKVAGEGFKSYWRWVQKKTVNPSGKGLGRGRYISDAKGVAQTVGIGLVVLGIALDAYAISQSEDRKGGRLFSYDLVKSYVGIALGVATLVAMFCIPIVGQVVAIATLIWIILSQVGDLLGEYNKRWKEAYKNSYWFLYQNDPTFRTFYENRGQLKREEKALSLLLAERDYGELARQPQPTEESDRKLWENGKKVFEALEKQGVLMTYYAQTGFTLPDFDINRLQDLWNRKADFMAWKPTEAEAEAAKNRGFWGNLGHAINPKTWIAWAGDKINSRGFDKELHNKDVKPVFFNPDYVLVKKYKNYLMGNDLKGGIYDTVGLRIEQSPFNYIPLVGIDTAAWSEALLKEAFNADAFQVGVKEMMYFREQIKAANESLKKVIHENDEAIEKIVKTDLPQTVKTREALAALLEAYNNDPDRVNDSLKRQIRSAFGWRWNDRNGPATPRNIIKFYQPDIEQLLTYVPLSIAQKAAEAILILVNLKRTLDTARLMRMLGEEKREVLRDFDNEFKNAAIKEYLRKGTFLDVKGKTFMDWLGGIYPAYEELEKFTNLYWREVEAYSGNADTANSTTRERFLWFDKEVTHPRELLKQLNDELKELKELTEAYEGVKDTLNLRMPIADNPEFKNGVYRQDGYNLDWDASQLMDVNNPIMAPTTPDFLPE